MLHQSNARPLRRALYANAVFSALCACVLVFAADWAATMIFVSGFVWPGLPAPQLFVLLGAALFVFAGLVAWAASVRLISRRAVQAVIIADASWVVLSLALLPVSGAILAATGIWSVSVTASIVLVFAAAQTAGLLMLYQGQSELTISSLGRTHRFRLSHSVDASADAAWRVMTDHEAYADVADNLSKVEVLQGEEHGMRRKCYGTKNESWTERAHIWEEGRRFGFIIDTGAPDYPYPLETLAAVWSVEPDGIDRSTVTMAFEVTPQASLKGGVFMALSTLMFPKVIDKLLGRWAVRMESLDGARPAVAA